jgi:Na+-transporting methylmalonyl-CoA/oxaloacetate decarboxylase gamma subunit
MAFGYVFIVLVIIAVIYAYISASQEEVEYVKSSLDGKDYLVQKMDNSQDAANVIASIADMVSLVNIWLPSSPRP